MQPRRITIKYWWNSGCKKVSVILRPLSGALCCSHSLCSDRLLSVSLAQACSVSLMWLKQLPVRGEPSSSLSAADEYCGYLTLLLRPSLGCRINSQVWWWWMFHCSGEFTTLVVSDDLVVCIHTHHLSNPVLTFSFCYFDFIPSSSFLQYFTVMVADW